MKKKRYIATIEYRGTPSKNKRRKPSQNINRKNLSGYRARKAASLATGRRVAEVFGGKKVDLVIIGRLVQLVAILGQLEGELPGNLLRASGMRAGQKRSILTTKHRW